MEAKRNNAQDSKKSADKLHDPELGETKDFDNLAYDKDDNSFEYDVKGKDKDYDHPLPYDTSAPNGEDFDSTYDEANPYDGSTYNGDKRADENLEEEAMHIDTEENLELDPEDEFLARTPEDNRDDLDEEGYPVNDMPK